MEVFVYLRLIRHITLLVWAVNFSYSGTIFPNVYHLEKLTVCFYLCSLWKRFACICIYSQIHNKVQSRISLSFWTWWHPGYCRIMEHGFPIFVSVNWWALKLSNLHLQISGSSSASDEKGSSVNLSNVSSSLENVSLISNSWINSLISFWVSFP